MKNFQFADIVQNNRPDPGTSSHYTYNNSVALTAHVIANGTTSYPISFQSGGTSSTYAEAYGIWIDYNQNGVFETNEFIYATPSATLNHVVILLSESITIIILLSQEVPPLHMYGRLVLDYTPMQLVLPLM